MKYFITLLFTFSVFFSAAQTEADDSAILENAGAQGNVMAKLLVEKDYKGFTKYVYSPVIKMMGGPEKMIEVLSKEMGSLEDDGIVFTKCSVERPKLLIRIKNEIQCTLRQNIEMKIPDGTMRVKSTLIGISQDEGKSWEFIDTQDKPINKLQEILPNLSNDLIIPAKQEPVIVEN